METTRRGLMAMGAAMPLIAAAAPVRAAAPAPLYPAWTALFAGAPGETFAWWYQGILYAHVDRLREFPVAGYHAVMIARTERTNDSTAIDFRTIGFFSDLDSGLPTARWHNAFTGRDEAIPPYFVEGPGRYAITPATDTLNLTALNSRTNRIVGTVERQAPRVMLTQIEGTLQGFPALDGTLPPLGSPAITERQTRIQLVAMEAALAQGTPLTGTRGFFNHVYDALPPWLGFGETLGSGLSKGQMRKAKADEIVNPMVWKHLQKQVPSAFSGNRLLLK